MSRILILTFIFISGVSVQALAVQLPNFRGAWVLARPGEGEDCARTLNVALPKPNAMVISPTSKDFPRPKLDITGINQSVTASFADGRIAQSFKAGFFGSSSETRAIELYPDNALVITVDSTSAESYRCVYIRPGK